MTGEVYKEEEKRLLCSIVSLHDGVGWPLRTQIYNEIAILEKYPKRKTDSLKKCWMRMGSVSDDSTKAFKDDNREDEQVRPEGKVTKKEQRQPEQNVSNVPEHASSTPSVPSSYTTTNQVYSQPCSAGMEFPVPNALYAPGFAQPANPQAWYNHDVNEQDWAAAATGGMWVAPHVQYEHSYQYPATNVQPQHMDPRSLDGMEEGNHRQAWGSTDIVTADPEDGQESEREE